MFYQGKSVAETVQRMKDEIIADARAGKVALGTLNFSELHDYVDANEYGGFCEDGFDPCNDEAVNFVNACQDAINDWLVIGGIRKDMK